MNLKLLTLSAAAASILIAATPMSLSSMSTDNGGTKLAIDAYSDGAGVLVIDQASSTKFDNSSMNRLVFKYGDAAKSSNTTLKNQIGVLSTTATAIEKADAASKLEIAQVVINPPSNGTNCNDNLPYTYLDKYTNNVCTGVIAKSCNEIKLMNQSAATGVYAIKPSLTPSVNVYCDMVLDGGGWTQVVGPETPEVLLSTGNVGYTGGIVNTASSIGLVDNVSCDSTLRGINIAGAYNIPHTNTFLENIDWGGAGNVVAGSDYCQGVGEGILSSSGGLTRTVSTYVRYNGYTQSTVDSLALKCACSSPNSQRGTVVGGRIYIK